MFRAKKARLISVQAALGMKPASLTPFEIDSRAKRIANPDGC